ncbi:MAG: glycosyltransferase, partial [Lachnospiraceae bacterium]
MKIAMMTNNYKPFIGGVPLSVERLAKGLRALGHEVCIFAPEYEEEEPEEEDVILYRS